MSHPNEGIYDRPVSDLPNMQSVTVDTTNARKLAGRFITKRWYFQHQHVKQDKHRFTFSTSVDLVRDLKGIKLFDNEGRK